MLLCYITKRAAIVSLKMPHVDVLHRKASSNRLSLKMPHVGVLHHKASSNRLSQNASCWCVTSQSEQQSSLSKCLMLVCYITKRAAIVSLKMPRAGVFHHKASSNRLSQNASCWCVTSQSEQQSSLSKCLELVCYITKRAAIVSLKMPHVGVLHHKASSNRLSQNASRWCVTSQSEQQSSLSKCLALVCYITKRAAIVSLSKCLMLVCYIAKRAAIVSLKMPLLVCYITKPAAIVSLKMPHVGVLHHKASSNRLSQNASCWCVTSQSEQQSSLSKCLALVCYITKRAAIVSLKMPRAGVLHHKASSNRLSLKMPHVGVLHRKASSNRLSQNASCWCVTSQNASAGVLITKRAAIVSLKMPHVGVLHHKASSNRLSQNASCWCVTSQSKQQLSLSKCLMLVCYIAKRAAIISLKMPRAGVLHHKASSNRLSQNASCWCVISQSEQQSSLSKCLMLVCYIAKRAAIPLVLVTLLLCLEVWWKDKGWEKGEVNRGTTIGPVVLCITFNDSQGVEGLSLLG